MGYGNRRGKGPVLLGCCGLVAVVVWGTTPAAAPAPLQRSALPGSPAVPAVAIGAPQIQEPWFEEDFSRYESTGDLLAPNNGGAWSAGAGEDVNTRLIILDTTIGVGPLRRSMRYLWPDRSSRANRCRDFSISRSIDLPRRVPEVWIEVHAMFSANFATLDRACGRQSTPDYKFIFGRVHNPAPGSSRFGIKVGTLYSQMITIEYPGGRGAVNSTSVPAGTYFDGTWHRWRFHWRLGRGTGLVVAYLDDRPIIMLQNIDARAAGIYGIKLGANLNQGPTQSQTLHWGLIRAWNTDPGWGW